MIKIKFSILAVMLMTALFSFSSCSDDDDTYLPPNQAIINALNQLYPGVKNIEWEQKGVYYVADCWVGNDELDVWFDANGQLDYDRNGYLFRESASCCQYCVSGRKLRQLGN